MDEIAIVLACDDRYAQHAAVAAASMLLCHTIPAFIFISLMMESPV